MAIVHGRIYECIMADEEADNEKKKKNGKIPLKIITKSGDEMAPVAANEEISPESQSGGQSTGGQINIKKIFSKLFVKRYIEEVLIQAGSMNKIKKNILDSAGKLEEKLKREMQQLVFYNPGPSTKDLLGFRPEFSNREKRKLNRLIDDKKENQTSSDEGTKSKRKQKQAALYDNEGRLNESGKDLCDCLVIDCQGCHYPCPKCQSEKCGVMCRANRKWAYDFVHYDVK